MLHFEWKDKPDIGRYKCKLYENDKVINDISFIDYTCKFCKKDDKDYSHLRPYSFMVHWCHGWSMEEGFDYDEDYDKHLDEKGCRIGGYQGNCTHTVDDIKKWCENWLAQKYLRSYYDTLDNLELLRERATWFENQGFQLESEEEPALAC